MTFEEFVLEVDRTYRASLAAGATVRLGQVAFNLLDNEKPDIANEVVSTTANDGVDPYYNNKNLPAFYKFVEERWDD